MFYDFKSAEKNLEKEFDRINDIRDFNQRKVLKAFFDNKVAPEHFYTVSGYGHDDLGREVLDKTFAQVFKAEKALVRIHFASGTHTLACALFGNLRAGDKLISVAGTPYDTMLEVIGTAGDDETKRSSLIGNGVLYDEVPLLNGTDIDFDALEKMVDEKTTMVLIQRSKGYSTRKSLTIETIEKIEANISAIGTFSWQALLVGAVCLAILIIFPKINKKIPGSLIALIVTTLLVIIFKLPVNTIETQFGEISGSIPAPTLPNINFEIIKNLKVEGKKTLIVLPSVEKNVNLSVRNIQRVEVMTASALNTYKVMNANVLVVTENALKLVDETFNK